MRRKDPNKQHVLEQGNEAIGAGYITSLVEYNNAEEDLRKTKQASIEQQLTQLQTQLTESQQQGLAAIPLPPLFSSDLNQLHHIYI